MTPQESERLLGIDEAAAQLGISERMMRRLLDEHRIPKIKIGRHVRIAPRALVAYVAEHTMPATK